jgi:hypothetical protein
MLDKTPRGIRNNNPGNIRRTDITWRGELVGGDPDFEIFDTPEHGIAAVGTLLRAYQDRHKICTIRQAITRYAPDSENDTLAYVTTVCKRTGIAPDAKIDFHDRALLVPIVKAIIWHENGIMPYTDAQFSAAFPKL